MKSDRRIGIVVPNDFVKRLPFGGASGFLQNVVATLDYPVVIFGAGANGTALWASRQLTDNASFVATYSLTFPTSYPLRMRALQGYLLNRRRILSYGVNLLYVHSPECALPFLFGRHRLPVVFHQHGSGNPVETAKYAWARNGPLLSLFDHMHRFIYRRSDWVVAIDRLCMEQAVCNGARKKVSLLMNAVDREKFRPDQAARTSMRTLHGCRQEDTVLLFVGRLEEVKQIDHILEGIALSNWPQRNRLFLAGEGTQHAFLQKTTEKLGLEDLVTFLGKISHDRLPGYYNMADALLLPSKMEGVPMVVLEALACGTPVIASAVGGIPDLVKHGENGLLLSPPTPQAIAAAIEELPRLQKERGLISATVARWDAVEVGAELSAIFHRLMRERATS